ncbi:MAG TPA: hypothetical protein VH560_01990 [Polyangia bacterium]|jgi:hypothetical protein|nr:hypothetical protein [Polyangia bacterium]
MRIWLACTGALLVMALVIYLALGSHVDAAGLQLGPTPALAGASSATPTGVVS